VIKYRPPLEANFRTRKRKVADAWRMDEAYINIKGKWVYSYRAVDKQRTIVDFYLSETRDEPASRTFLIKHSIVEAYPAKSLLIKAERILRRLIRSMFSFGC
jgi:putative transposase